MSSRLYNAGAKAIADRTVDFAADTIEIVLVKSTYTMNPDDVNGTPAASEITGVSGYVGGFGGAGRKVLATKTITNDTANDRTVFDAADPSAWTLGVGDTPGGAVIQKKGSASDATAVPLFFLSFTAVPTNGSTFTLVFDALGIAYLQN